MERNVIKLKVDNTDKDLGTYLKPQWSWKTLVTIAIFSFVLMRFTLLICFLILACNSSQKEIPEKILQEKEMVSILTDIHLLKGKVSVWRKTQSVSQLQEDSLFQQLYVKHNINKAILDSSLVYYSREESEILEEIYTDVLETLQKQEANLGN